MEKSTIVYILQSRKKSERKIQLKHILYMNDSLVALFFRQDPIILWKDERRICANEESEIISDRIS